MRHQRTRALGLILGIASGGILMTSRATATDVCGTISTSTTWTTGGSPYIVTCDVLVENNGTVPTLTIQAGVTVKFNSGRTLTIGQNYPGTLSAVGTSGSQITFTANTGTPTRGYWNAIKFMPNATASSQLKYATISWGGVASQFGAIYVNGPSVTIQNVTVSQSLSGALTVINGAPIISSSTFTASDWGIVNSTGTPSVSSSTVSSNTYGGIYLTSPAAPLLQSVSINSNTGFAVSQDAKVTLASGSSVSASGNTQDGIELRNNSYVDVTTTWRAVGIPYVLNGAVYVEKAGGPAPVLNISPGVTIKSKDGGLLRVGSGGPGSIQANGSPSSAITFTANTGSPPPGYWFGIELYSNTVSSSISFATVSYGGLSAGGISVQGSSPSITNVTLSNNANAGIRLNGGLPVISGCSFIGNSAGIINDQTANVVDARFSFWNAVSGPSGSGPGTGQSVSAGVKFEPWLTAAQSTTQYFNTFTGANRTFNPTIGVNNHLTMGSVLSGNWTLNIMNSGGGVVRTATGSGFSAAFVWDGKNGSGTPQPLGTYTYEFQSISGGSSATPARGLSIISSTALGLTGSSVAPAFFSPNADTVQDTATLTATVSFDGGTWTINVKNSGGSTVRTQAGSGAAINYAWDGKNGSGAVQPDGLYTFSVSLIDDGASATVTGGTSTLDNTLPVASVTAPAPGITLSNVYQSGVTDINVTGSATDTNINNWTLDYGAGASPPSWTTINTGTSPVSAAQLGTWVTLPLTNGLYTLRLRVWDKAGNLKTLSNTDTVGNFSVSKNDIGGSPVYQLNAGAGQTVTYKSEVPFSLTETLTIKNEAGQTVRTLFSGTRAVGTYSDVWDGKTGPPTPVLLPDGGYFYYATVTAGTYTYTWDLSSQYIGGFYFGATVANPNTYDPFTSQPLIINYSFAQPGRITVLFSSAPGGPFLGGGCTPPLICTKNNKYEESGPHTVYWAGADGTGRFYPGSHSVAVGSNLNNFPRNGLVLYGTAPQVTGVSSSPFVYGPAIGTQTISFTLATYQNQNVGVSVSFLNQDSLTVLRTVSLTNQAPGVRTAVWDGKADNGMPVAPGLYLVTVTATDSIGNKGTGQVMTAVQY